MTESKEHHDLIDVILEYVDAHFPGIEKGLFYIDRPGYERPRALSEGMIPDFYYENSGYMIIGEAKTRDDIDNPHTEKQFESYLRRAKSAEELDELTPRIIYAVPNDLVRHTRKYLALL